MEIDFRKLVKLSGIQQIDQWDKEPNPFRQFKLKAMNGKDPKWSICSIMLQVLLFILRILLRAVFVRLLSATVALIIL